MKSSVSQTLFYQKCKLEISLDGENLLICNLSDENILLYIFRQEDDSPIWVYGSVITINKGFVLLLQPCDKMRLTIWYLSFLKCPYFIIVW